MNHEDKLGFFQHGTRNNMHGLIRLKLTCFNSGFDYSFAKYLFSHYTFAARPCSIVFIPYQSGCCWRFFRAFRTQSRTSLDDCWRHNRATNQSLCGFWGIHLQWTHFNDVQHTWWINEQHAGHVIQFKLFTELKVEFLKVCCMETESRAVSPCIQIQSHRAVKSPGQNKTLHSAVVSFYKRKMVHIPWKSQLLSGWYKASFTGGAVRVLVTDLPLLSCWQSDWGAERPGSAAAARCSSEAQKKQVAELKRKTNQCSHKANEQYTIFLIFTIKDCYISYFYITIILRCLWSPKVEGYISLQYCCCFKQTCRFPYEVHFIHTSSSFFSTMYRWYKVFTLISSFSPVTLLSFPFSVFIISRSETHLCRKKSRSWKPVVPHTL